MLSISASTLVTFAISIVLQVAALTLLPMTGGFTKLVPTAGCIITFSVAIGLLARIVMSGVQLGTLIPLSAASVPIAVIVSAVIIYHEAASVPRLLTLIAACCLIGIASNL